MGTRGPVGKRSDARLGHRAKDEAELVTKAPAAEAVTIPPADAEWHPVAQMVYASLSESGQKRFFEPSDWALAYLLCESISLDLKPQFVGFAASGRDQTEAEFAVIPLKGASLSAYLKGFGSLLMSEGDRRRAGIELQRGAVVDDDEVAAVAMLDDYRTGTA